MFLSTVLSRLNADERHIAYTTGGRRYTYGELAQCAAALQQVLLQQHTNAPVMVYGSKEMYMKAGMLACLFSGIPYVPADASFPCTRTEEIIAMAKPSCIIGEYESETVPVLRADTVQALCEQQGDSPLRLVEKSDEDTAYIIFTSGSTGKPKGVVVSYRNLNSCVLWLDSLIKESRCVLNQAKFSFDLSVADLYLSLMKGAEHFVPEEAAMKSFPLLFRRLGESGADTAVMTPSFAELLLLDKSFNSTLMPRLSTVLFCGETLKPQTVKRLMDRFEGLKVINCYGPTEATFAVTSTVITEEDTALAALPVGRAKPGVELVISPEGEIVIVGDSVAKGYLPPADATAFCEADGKPAYRTGDFGYMKDGMLWFSGRRDNQLKLSGFRIELGDIEQNLLALDGVATAVAVPKQLPHGTVASIAAYVVPEHGAHVTAAHIKNALQKRLPPYMIPKIRIVEQLPLTANGKCDLKRLTGEDNA